MDEVRLRDLPVSDSIRGSRPRVLEILAQQLVADPVRREHPLRVAVEGVTGAGKSTFAAELAGAVSTAGAPALQLSADDFDHRTERRHRDPDPARGYYRDAYNLPALRRLVLDPLGAGRAYTP